VSALSGIEPGALLDLAAVLVDIASPSRAESTLAGEVERFLSAVPWLAVERIGDNVVARTDNGRAQRLVLAGHLDTVPPQGNGVARVDGDTLWGVGACDMKGTLAVMLDLARTLETPAVDATYVFYAREEIAASESGLEELFEVAPHLLVADAAVLGEPSAGGVEAGCQGTMRVRLRLHGEAAHTARAWMGRNAIHRLGSVLSDLARFESRRPIVNGLQFHEAAQAVYVEGGTAGNVVPDRAELTVNLRFAPDRTSADAEAAFRSLVGVHLDPHDDFEVLDRAEAAWPALDHLLLTPLTAELGLEVRPKLGWTDVARFSARGTPAINVGAGDAVLAHRADEHVTAAELHHVDAVYRRLLGGQSRRSTETTLP